MFRVHAQKFLPAVLVLFAGAGTLAAQTPPASPLTAAPATVAVSYQKPGDSRGYGHGQVYGSKLDELCH